MADLEAAVVAAAAMVAGVERARLNARAAAPWIHHVCDRQVTYCGYAVESRLHPAPIAPPVAAPPLQAARGLYL